jgi:hypothetical protein
MKMKELHSHQYIDSLNINSEKIEYDIQFDYLDVLGKANKDEIENKTNPPSVVAPFYYHMYKQRKVPKQQEYIADYFNLNIEWINENIGKNTNKLNGLTGRLDRTYPSLMREVHFYLLLKEQNYFKSIYQNVYYDLVAKIDIIIRSNSDKLYGLQLRTATVRSNYYVKKKPFRDMDRKVDIHLIDLPLNLSSAKSINTKGNSFKLYSKNEADNFKIYIDTIES